MVAVGISGLPKKNASPWESLLRERVQVEIDLRDELVQNQEKMDKYEQVVEERDAWKASTRQLEASVFDLSQRNRKLEEAIIQLDDSQVGSQDHDQRKSTSQHVSEITGDDREEGSVLQAWRLETSKQKSSDANVEATSQPGSATSTRPPTPLLGEGPRRTGTGGGGGNAAITLSDIKQMIQQHHARGDDKPQPLNRTGKFIDFSKTGCPRCHKDLVLVV